MTDICHASATLAKAVWKGDLRGVANALDAMELKKWQQDDVCRLLCEAIQNRHTGVAKLLLERCSNVNFKVKERNDNTALHFAALHGNVEIVRRLLDKGANVNTRNDIFEIPLHLACMQGHSNIVQLLLLRALEDDRLPSRSLSVTSISTVCSKRRGFPVMVKWTEAVERKLGSMAKFLINNIGRQKDNKNDKSVNHEDTRTKFMDSYDKMVGLLADKKPINCHTASGLTPLHLAVSNKRQRVVKMLLTFGADIDAETNEGKTPLHYATYMGCSYIAEMLINRGCNVDATDLRQRRPIDVAIKKNRVEIAEMLLKAGADVQNLGEACHLAMRYSRKRMLMTLLKYGVDVDARDDQGKTLLHYAIRDNWDDEFVMFLLDKGTDIEAVDKQGCTTLKFAIAVNRHHIARELIDRGINVNASPGVGSHPPLLLLLHIIHEISSNPSNVLTGSMDVEEVVKTLQHILDNGADVNLVVGGESILHFCRLNRYAETVMLRHMAKLSADNRRIGETNFNWIARDGRLQAIFDIYKGQYYANTLLTRCEKYQKTV